MHGIPNEVKSSRLLTLIATILVVAVLYLARAVLVPLALALLLSFLLEPLVARLQRAGLSRIPSVIIASMMSFAVIGVLGYVFAVETISLAESLPRYRENIREKVRAIAAPGALTSAKERIQQATEEIIQATTSPDTPASKPATSPAVTPVSIQPPDADTNTDEAMQDPMPVEVVEREPNALDTLAAFVHPLLGPLGTAGIIVIFVVFMSIQREDLRDRLIALSGTSHIPTTTIAISDATDRVSRYLFMQFVVNLAYGLIIGIGLLVIGVPNAALWGMMCVVLRYIPYVGPWLGAAMPVLLALAVFDDWSRPLMVIGLFVVVEVISNNVIEPWLYGSGTGVSPMAVLISAVFWTWLWGVPGLVLATPLTVCVVVLGRHFPQMKWLAVMLGDEPGLAWPARVYQRLLAADQDELLELAQRHLEDHDLLEWYDDVLVPALTLAEQDRHEGVLNEQRSRTVFAAARELIDDLGELTAKRPLIDSDATGDASRSAPPPILIAAAHDEADELAAIMLMQLLAQSGQRAQVIQTGGLMSEAGDRAQSMNPSVICVSSMPPIAVSHARHLCKRLRERLPRTPLIVGLWNAHDLPRATMRMQSSGATAVVASLAKAIEKLRQ